MITERKKAQKQLGRAKTVVSEYLAVEADPKPLRPGSGRPLGGSPEASEREEPNPPGRPSTLPTRLLANSHSVERLTREWLQDLKVMGRSPKTLSWYRQHMSWYLEHEHGVRTLEELDAAELKRLLASLQDRGLTPNTVHGWFQVIRSFASWCGREGYPVDLALLKLRPPKVPQTEMETYSEAQIEAIIAAAAPGWPRMAIQILLGTGMRVSELAALTVEDYEDDGETAFLKIQSGKGAKFRRVPVSSRLRRELDRYLNRMRPDADSDRLLLLSNRRPVGMMTVEYLFRRIRHKVGIRVHAHKFRHTFATEYLRHGGEMERLRRILGHTSYVMVMRYLHLDKGDLGRDFDSRTPF